MKYNNAIKKAIILVMLKSKPRKNYEIKLKHPKL
jgi:hypothetical protein